MNPQSKRRLFQWLLLIVFLFGAGIFYVFFSQHLTFDNFKVHHKDLNVWINKHYLLGSLFYILSYTLIVATSITGASIATIVGGYLFGLFAGTLYVVLSATLGALILFLLVKYVFADWFNTKTSARVNKLKQGFNINAFNYLLFLRLVPLFPFWLINIASALLKVRLWIFFSSTLIGIIPGTFVYVSIGNGLENIASQDKIDMNVIFLRQIFLPLLGVGILALLPIFYKKQKGGKHV